MKKHLIICKTCINFEQDSPADQGGDCTRYPKWIFVTRNHHCGEHEFNLVIQKEIKKAKDV